MPLVALNTVWLYNTHINNAIGEEMFSHLISFILGIVVATVGFTGIANIADKGVSKVQEAVKEAQ